MLAESRSKNHLINLTHGCLCSDSVDNYAKGMFWFWFLIFVQHVASLFAVATGTTISFGLCRQYRPVFSLSFLNVYGICISLNIDTHGSYLLSNFLIYFLPKLVSKKIEKIFISFFVLRAFCCHFLQFFPSFHDVKS